MPMFVFADDGSRVNLGSVRRIGGTRDGRYRLYFNDGTLDPKDCHSDPLEGYIMIVPAPPGAWEMVGVLDPSDGGDWAVWSEPVVAFGLTAEGDVWPVSVMSLMGAGRGTDSALREVATGRIYEPHDCVTDSTEAWLERRKKVAAAERAARKEKPP